MDSNSNRNSNSSINSTSSSNNSSNDSGSKSSSNSSNNENNPQIFQMCVNIHLPAQEPGWFCLALLLPYPK